ncbi:MAG: hypothetical protein ABIP29_11600 [Candidatus Eisenbacteria bacterium]
MATEMNLATRLKQAQEHQEGPVARTIEEETAKVPSDLFLWTAIGAIGLAATLFKSGRKADAMFVGQWVAPILTLGLYNKLVKVAGSDQLNN